MQRRSLAVMNLEPHEIRHPDDPVWLRSTGICWRGPRGRAASSTSTNGRADPSKSIDARPMFGTDVQGESLVQAEISAERLPGQKPAMTRPHGRS